MQTCGLNCILISVRVMKNIKQCGHKYIFHYDFYMIVNSLTSYAPNILPSLVYVLQNQNFLFSGSLVHFSALHYLFWA